MIWINLKYLPHYEGLPEIAKQTEGSSGYDLYAAISETVSIAPQSVTLIPTGISMSIPQNYEAQVRSRSGLATKGVFTMNSPGTVDSDYRGEVKVILCNLGKEEFKVERGMRVAQMVICPLVEVNLRVSDDLDSTERGAGGFGSTGV